MMLELRRMLRTFLTLLINQMLMIKSFFIDLSSIDVQPLQTVYPYTDTFGDDIEGK